MKKFAGLTLVLAIVLLAVLGAVPVMAQGEQPTLVFEEVTGFVGAEIPASSLRSNSCQALFPDPTVSDSTATPFPYDNFTFLPFAGMALQCRVIPSGTSVLRTPVGGTIVKLDESTFVQYDNIATSSIGLPQMTNEELYELMTSDAEIPSDPVWKLVHAQPLNPTSRHEVYAYLDIPPGPSRWAEWKMGEELSWLDNHPEDIVVPIPVVTLSNNLPMLFGSMQVAQRCPAVAGRLNVGAIYEGFFWDASSNAWMATVQWIDGTMLSRCPHMPQYVFLPGSAITANLPQQWRDAVDVYIELKSSQWDLNLSALSDFSMDLNLTPEERQALVTVTAVGGGTLVLYAAIQARTGTGPGSGTGGGGMYVFSAIPVNPKAAQ